MCLSPLFSRFMYIPCKISLPPSFACHFNGLNLFAWQQAASPAFFAHYVPRYLPSQSYWYVKWQLMLLTHGCWHVMFTICFFIHACFLYNIFSNAYILIINTVPGWICYELKHKAITKSRIKHTKLVT